MPLSSLLNGQQKASKKSSSWSKEWEKRGDAIFTRPDSFARGPHRTCFYLKKLEPGLTDVQPQSYLDSLSISLSLRAVLMQPQHLAFKLSGENKE